jgi:hypothetical protein
MCPAENAIEVHDEITDTIDKIYGDMGFGDHPAPRVMYKDSKGGGGEDEEEGEEGEEAEEGEEEEEEEEAEAGEHAAGGGGKEE